MYRNPITLVIMILTAANMGFAEAKPGGFARQAALGGSALGSGVVLNPFVWSDPAWMYLNPAQQSMYADYAWLNIGGGQLVGASTGNNGYGLQNVGISFSLSKELAVGLIGSHDPSAANLVSGLISGSIGGVFVPGVSLLRTRAPQSIPAIANVWEAFASLDLGDLDLGFGFMYGTSNSDSTSSLKVPPTTIASSFNSEASSRMIGFRFGVLMDMGGGSGFEGAASLRLDNATDEISTITGGVAANAGTYSASGTEITALARLKLKMSNKVNFIPYGMLALISASPKEDTPPTGLQPLTRKVDVSGLAYGVGVGGEYRTPSVYLAGGVSFQSIQLKAELSDTGAIGKTTTTISYTAIPVFNVGGEWWFTDWMAGRGGYYRSIGSQKFELETPAFTGEGSITNPNSLVLIGGLNPATWDGIVTLGLGFKFGNFSLDATISEEALRRGLGLIGSSDNLNTFGYLFASYNFE